MLPSTTDRMPELSPNVVVIKSETFVGDQPPPPPEWSVTEILVGEYEFMKEGHSSNLILFISYSLYSPSLSTLSSHLI